MPDDTVPTPPQPDRLQQVLVDLLEEFPVEQVVDEALAEVRAEVPGFRDVEPTQMRADVSGALTLAVEVMARGVDEGGLESDALRSIGAMRAEQGIEMDDMLAGFRIVARVSVDKAVGLAQLRGISPMAILDLTRVVWVHCDEAAAELAAGHRAWTDDPVRRTELPAETSLRRLLRGDLSPASTTRAAADLGLDADAAYVVVVISDGPSSPEDLDADITGRLRASYVDRAEKRVIGLVSQPPEEPWGCFVGYGDPAGLLDLRSSFRGAVAAWELVVAFGIETPRHPDDVQLLRPVQAMPSLGDEFVERCFGHLDDAKRDALVETLRAWFATDGSADAAAELLFVHRNTLRYRLRAFTAATGLGLDRPEDAFVVWWALRRLDLLARAPRAASTVP